MNKTSIFAAVFAVVAMVGCTPAIAQDTNYAFRLPCELQSASPSSLVDLEWQQGTTPHIAVCPLRLGKPVAADTLTTVRMIIGTSGTVTNYAQATNWLATNSIYYVQWPTIGTNSGTNAWWYTVYFERDGRTYWTGNGRLFIEETTSTSSNGLVWQTISYGAAVDATARAQIGALSNYVDVVASTGGGTATVTYGVASNTAYRGDWGASVSNTAAAASSTGTVAYALAATKVSTNDPRYLAALTNAAAFATAAQGAKADSAIQTNHTGNVSVLGRFGLGTNAVTAYPPTRTNAANLLHLVDGGIYLEDKPHLLGGGSATSQTAAIFLGYDAREFGCPALWLNSYDYESGGNTYDAASDIYFGKGAAFTDASLRWGLSSRPTNQGWGHESDGQFLIYEFPGLGSSGVGGTRFSIFPDTGGIGGPIKLGTETRYPPPSPDPAATLVVNDWTKSPVIVIEGNTNAGAASFPRVRFVGGTNIADVTWSNGVLYSSAAVSVPQLALGTNAAVSNWPVSQGQASAITNIGFGLLGNGTNDELRVDDTAVFKINSTLGSKFIDIGDTNANWGTIRIGNPSIGKWLAFTAYGSNIFQVTSTGGFIPLWKSAEGTNQPVWLGAVKMVDTNTGATMFKVDDGGTVQQRRSQKISDTSTNDYGTTIVLNGTTNTADSDGVWDLGTITGTGGLTNNQTGVSLGGTFTGEHVGNGASLTNLTDAAARASITAMGDGIHPRILANVTNGTATLWASSSAWWRVNCDTNALTNWVIDTTGVSSGDTVAMAVEIYRPNANTWAWMPGVTNSSPATNATTLNCFVLISGATNWLVNP